MTLTRRLTLFFLFALAVVLVAFSLALFALVRAHLRQTLDDKLTATLNVLIAAAEVNEEGVEWEPNQRLVRIVRDAAAPVRWVVQGDRPLAQDRSSDPDWEPLPDFAPDDGGTFDHRDSAGLAWRIRQTALRHDAHTPLSPEPQYHSKLAFTVAVGVDPTDRLLTRLALALAAVSASVLLLAALLGRWLCRRALSPVRGMAIAASAIPATDLAARLPLPTPPDELRALATAFNELLARVQVSFERQAAFTGEASHQLCTPLTALIGQTEVALRRDRTPDEYRATLATAHREAQRLHRLVECLLFLARADGESRMPDTEPLDLTAWLPAHLNGLWADHPRGASIRVVVPAGPVVVVANRSLLAQAVDNVVDNSFKHGGLGVTVTVTVSVRGESVLLTVDDNGRGIPEAERDRVFEPFFRSEDARRLGNDGTGLGLSVSARIIRSFGGKIAALPQQGGARIAILLPAVGG